MHHCFARLKKVDSHIIEFEVNVAHLFAACIGKHSTYSYRQTDLVRKVDFVGNRQNRLLFCYLEDSASCNKQYFLTL